MLYTVKTLAEEILTDKPIVFGENEVLYGPNICHTADSAAISIRRPGIYIVNFNADVTSDVAGTVTARLRVNGAYFIGAVAQAYISIPTALSNIKFAALVEIPPIAFISKDKLPVSLSVLNTGIDAEYQNAGLVITRIR